MSKRIVPLLLPCLLACGTGSQKSSDTFAAAPADSYAERTYATFAGASNGSVQYALRTVKTGSMADLRGQDLRNILTPAASKLQSKTHGTIVETAEVVDRGDDSAFFKDGLVDNFEKNGHPLAQGTYRLLDVTMQVNGKEMTYRALEAKWADFAVVADPVNQQVDSFAQVHDALTAEGWGPVNAASKAPASSSANGVVAAASKVCALSNHHTWGGETVTWGSYHDWWSDIFGLHLVDFYMGKQQVGVDCAISGSSCIPDVSGYSDDSSCSAKLGYSCACKNTGPVWGRTGSTMSVSSESECDYTNPFSGSANVSYSKDGVGAGLTLNWSSHGAAAEDFNGGHIVETCGWF